MVRVTDLSVSTNGSLVRISTYGRGIWEAYPQSEPPAAAGKGDFDRNGVIDFFDLAPLAARLGTTPALAGFVPDSNEGQLNPRYDSSVDLDGSSTLDDTDLTALLNKFGSTP
jgi:hypothetical protein